MAENLRTRVGRIISGGAHALLDKIEDMAPDAMMEQAIRGVDEVIDEVRAELGRVAANRHLAQQQHAALNKSHVELGENLEHAIAENREDLARAAAGRQLDIEAQLPVLETTLAGLGKEEIELKGYVGALLAKKREMQEALENFRASRAKMASPVGGEPGASPVIGRLEGATEAFDKVFTRQTGISPTAYGASLDEAGKIKELEDMVRQNKINERLAQMKASKGG